MRTPGGGESTHRHSRRSRIKKSTSLATHAAPRASDSSLEILAWTLAGGGVAREAEYPATVEDLDGGYPKRPTCDDATLPHHGASSQVVPREPVTRLPPREECA